MIDFRLPERVEEFRAEVREFVEEHIDDGMAERIYRSGVSHDPDFSRALAARGWVAPNWPVEYGGQALDPMMMMALYEELRLAAAPVYGVGTTTLTAGTIREVGTEAQKREILPKALAGEIIIVMGYTEPECGSDVAAAQTRAVRDGDDWVINGSKMFTTNAQIGDYVFLLTRTNTEVPKHKGLTMFLVPMDQPGVEIQAVYTLSGERTNITYYNDVRVSDEWRVGEVDGGWATMAVALGLEHGASFAFSLRKQCEAAQRWASAAVDDHGVSRAEDPAVQAEIGRTAADAEIALLLLRRSQWVAAEPSVPSTGAEGPMSKLLSSEMLEQRTEAMAALMGPDGLRSYFDPTAPVHGELEHNVRHALGTTIYAGTSEMHRNMIALRHLGLPRSR